MHDLLQVHYLSGPIRCNDDKGVPAQPGDILTVEILNLGPLPGDEWGFGGVFDRDNGGGFLTDHFPDASKAIWDFDGIYCTSRHIPGVRFAGWCLSLSIGFKANGNYKDARQERCELCCTVHAWRLLCSNARVFFLQDVAGIICCLLSTITACTAADFSSPSSRQETCWHQASMQGAIHSCVQSFFKWDPVMPDHMGLNITCCEKRVSPKSWHVIAVADHPNMHHR